MNSKRILIVEDEFIIAQNLRQILVELGFEVAGHAFDAQEALGILAAGKTDLALLDIRISGDMDGIALADRIRKDYGIPVVFLTSHSDKGTIERAKATHPSGFLVKPFSKAEIFATIEIVLANWANMASSDHLFVKVGTGLKKVHYHEITMFKADRVYVEVHRKGAVPLVVRESLSAWEGKLPAGFVRVHRSYIIHVKHIEALETGMVVVDGKEIPITKQVRDELAGMI